MTAQATTNLSLQSPGESGQDRLDDLAQIISTYNEVTDRLQRSHESLRSQVVRLQDELASADAQIQRSKRLSALGEMAAGIAHEIRNPLAAIHLYAGQLVEDLPDQTPARQTAGKIADVVRGLNAVVNDVLSFAREVRPRVSAISVADLFSRAVTAQVPMLDERRIELQRPDDQLIDDLYVRADADLIHQALVNLLRNAAEAVFTRDEAGQGLVTLAARKSLSQVELTVRDNGPGIDEDAIDRIFNPFFTTRSTGTGLGLAIVHRIVDVHGGTIGVHNDGGAVFTLSLPAACVDADRDQESTGDRSAAGSMLEPVGSV